MDIFVGKFASFFTNQMLIKLKNQFKIMLAKRILLIIAESGFELLARIEIKDKKTGRCFR